MKMKNLTRPNYFIIKSFEEKLIKTKIIRENPERKANEERREWERYIFVIACRQACMKTKEERKKNVFNKKKPS